MYHKIITSDFPTKKHTKYMFILNAFSNPLPKFIFLNNLPKMTEDKTKFPAAHQSLVPNSRFSKL